MTRTTKGSKAPGWEPWSNKHEKAEQKAGVQDTEPHWLEDECPGCRECICIKCGGHMVVSADSVYELVDQPPRCNQCGHVNGETP